jgi:hypothetical protein
LHHFRGLQSRAGPKFTRPYGQLLTIAVMLFVTPLAILLLMRSKEWSAPSLEIRQEGVTSRGTRDTDGTAQVQETAVERASLPSAPQERTAALKIDGITRSTAMLQENSGDAGVNPRADIPPQEGAHIPGSQVPASHDAVADAAFFSSFWSSGRNKLASAAVPPGRQDKGAPALQPQAPPHRNKAAAARTIVLPKTVNTATIGPKPPAQSASTALLEHSMDRLVLAAAPGG